MVKFNIIDRAFENSDKHFTVGVCYFAVKSGLDHLGIELSEVGKQRLLDELSAAVENSQSKEFSPDISLEYCEEEFLQEPPEGVLESFELTQDDWNNAVENATKHWKETLEELYPELIETLSSNLFQQLMKDAERIISEQRQERLEFDNGIQEIWGKPLFLLETLFSYGNHICSEYTKHISDKMTNDYENLTDALTRLNARGQLVASEIFTLLSKGYADGAMARWRTLYELMVISLFLEKHGEKTAQQFLDYLIVESFHGMQEYDKYSKQFGWDSIPENDLRAAETEYREILKKHGKGFKGYYGWAKSVFPKEKISFNKIQQDVIIGHSLPSYRQSNWEVHASPYSMLFRLGFEENPPTNYVLSGRSFLGLDEPGKQSAVTLTQLISILLSHKDGGDAIIHIKALSKMVDEIKKEFDIARVLLQKRTDLEWNNP